MTAQTAAPAPARKSETGDKAPKAVGTCNCQTVKIGKAFGKGVCTAPTKKSFAQGHDARMSARVATEIALGEITMAEGLAEIQRAGGGMQLASKTEWSAKLRAKKLAAKARKGQEGAKEAAEAHAEQIADKPKAAKVVTKSADSVKIKIGRWEYLAEIDDKGDAHYTNRRDEEMTATKGSYSLVK